MFILVVFFSKEHILKSRLLVIEVFSFRLSLTLNKVEDTTTTLKFSITGNREFHWRTNEKPRLLAIEKKKRIDTRIPYVNQAN